MSPRAAQYCRQSSRCHEVGDLPHQGGGAGGGAAEEGGCQRHPVWTRLPNGFLRRQQGVVSAALLQRDAALQLLKPTFLFAPQFYLHNHLSFILYFHKEKLEEGDVHNYRVVRFEVLPHSVRVDGRPPPPPPPLASVDVKGRKTCWFLLRPESCRERQDVHAARRQRLRPPGNRPHQSERGPVHLLCALEGQWGASVTAWISSELTWKNILVLICSFFYWKVIFNSYWRLFTGSVVKGRQPISLTWSKKKTRGKQNNIQILNLK